MKLSKYNIIKKDKGKMVIYNTLSRGVLRLNEEYTGEMERVIAGDFNISNELLNSLKKGNIINEFDEVKNIKTLNLLQRYNTDTLNLTIAPTLECNFKCHYCYEEGVRYNRMDEKTIEGVIDFIAMHLNVVKGVNIAWYGGEPLMAIDTMEKITEKIQGLLREDQTIQAAIVSNGYLFDREMAERLKKIHVKSAQFTIDGSKKSHDNRRILLNGEGTFDKIFENIKQVYDIMPINIRINVDKTNIEDAIEIIDYIEDAGLKNKVGFYVAPVQDLTGKCGNNVCFSSYDFSEKEIRFYEEAVERGFKPMWIKPPSIGNCGAVAVNSYVIDPVGDLYKCWNCIGRKEECIGNILENKLDHQKHLKWLGYDPLENKGCKECTNLPLCMGGCPYFSIVANGKQCLSSKFNSTQMLELFLAQKEMNK